MIIRMEKMYINWLINTKWKIKEDIEITLGSHQHQDDSLIIS